ncbi:MAG: NUDIX hydrolase [Terricaulis sp.]
MKPDAMKRDDVHVHSKTSLHDGALKLINLKFDAPRFSGESMEAVEREIVLRPDSAAALVHDIERDVIVLCEQFRAAAYVAGGGWLIELPAGKIDGKETPEQCIRRELEEEIGYRPRALDPIGSFYASAGYSTERIHLFYAPVLAADLVTPEARGVDEHEDIRRIEQPLSVFLERIKLGAYEDAKILVAGAWAQSRLGA